MTYSTDLRRKALWIKQRDHLSFEAVAKRFGVDHTMTRDTPIVTNPYWRGINESNSS